VVTFMIKKHKSFTSSSILLFLGIIFLIVLGNEIYINKTLNKFSKYHFTSINILGQIRGGIQRYTKLKIYHYKYKLVEKKIDKNFKTIDLYLQKKYIEIPQKYLIEFYNLLNNIKRIWKEIKKTSNKNKLIILSEEAWKQSNKLTTLMTKITTLKLTKLRFIVKIFTFVTILIIALLSIFIFYYVKIGLEKATITDPLTKLYNRLFFDHQYKHHINKFERKNSPFSLLLFDIDDFKKINDTYGHPVGDEVLQKIAKTIKQTIRNTDFAFRVGGEEFLILFPDTNQQEALKIAKRLQKAIKNIKINGKSITISGGVGEYDKKYSSNHFLTKIDQALYQAKKSGKDKIIPIT